MVSKKRKDEQTDKEIIIGKKSLVFFSILLFPLPLIEAQVEFSEVDICGLETVTDSFTFYLVCSSSPFYMPSASAQTVNVNATEPCFLNFTAGADMWQNCGADTDFLTFMLLPWEWVSGGYFSMIFVSLMVAFTYIKYHKAIYPLMIGIAYLPISFYLFPNQLIIVPFLLVGALIGVFIYSMLMHRTKEYNG